MVLEGLVKRGEEDGLGELDEATLAHERQA